MDRERKRRISSREAQRIRLTKERHGEDFYQRNAVHAGRHTPTKFNSETGRKAAIKRHQMARERKARLAAEKGDQNNG